MKNILKFFLLSTFCFLLFTLKVQAGCSDLVIKKITHDTNYSIKAVPVINMTISNPSSTICNQPMPAGFISCFRNGSEVFKSNAIATFVLNAGNDYPSSLKLSNSISQEAGEKTIICNLNSPARGTGISFKMNVSETRRFDTALDKSIVPIRGNLDAAEGSIGVQGVQNFIFKKAIDIVFPIILVVGLLVAMMGFYKILFSGSEDGAKDGINFIIYGVLGIIIITSAKYISGVLFNDLFASGNMSTMSPVDIAQQLYDKIAFPFIKIVIYLVLGFLFISLAFRVFSFITAGDDSAKKKSGGIILRDVIAMLIIIGSKQIIQAVYGTKEQVLNVNAQNLGEIGSGILADKNIPILYSVISWIMGLTALVILILIIVQSLQLLLKPDDADKIRKIKKSIIYIFAGVLVIGTGYILTNVLIVN